MQAKTRTYARQVHPAGPSTSGSSGRGAPQSEFHCTHHADQRTAVKTLAKPTTPPVRSKLMTPRRNKRGCMGYKIL